MPPLARVPGYQLVEYLGGGPMTAAFTARDLATDAVCVIKTVRPDWEDRSLAIRLLQQEARAGLAIRHPRLVRFLDAHVLDEPYFLVMDFLPGESLRRRLRREFRLPVHEVVWIVRQLAEGVAALHSAGYLHGDVKPDNVRLTPDGTATLIDLGFAHRPGELARFLADGYILGTAAYLAPELSGPDVQEEDVGSDLFSLGVTLFELLSGRLPYPPGNLTQTLRRHRCDPPADIRRLRRLPTALCTLVQRLLARRSEDRPRAAAVVQQLIKLEIASLAWRKAV